MKIYVIIGSTRQNRFGDKPASWIAEELKKKDGIEVELIDLRDWPLPFFDEPASPSMNNGIYVNELAAKWAEKIAEADGYVIVTPEYNHGYPAVLKNALDYAYREWNKKPVAFMSYGAVAGGTRAVQQLRLVAIELQMVPIRAGVHLPMYWTHLDDKGMIKPEVIQESTNIMIDQLIWWVKALKTARGKVLPQNSLF